MKLNSSQHPILPAGSSPLFMFFFNHTFELFAFQLCFYSPFPSLRDMYAQPTSVFIGPELTSA